MPVLFTPNGGDDAKGSFTLSNDDGNDIVANKWV